MVVGTTQCKLLIHLIAITIIALLALASAANRKKEQGESAHKIEESKPFIMTYWTDAVEGNWAVDNIDPNDNISISSLGSMTSLNKAKNSTELEGRLVTIAKAMNKKINNLTMQVTKANPICKM